MGRGEGASRRSGASGYDAMVEITLVRHAESESNVTGRWQGQGDSQLSDEGQSQARALAARLAGDRFDLVVCSDLSRCCDTAAAIGLPTEKACAWREIDVGRWEGLTRPEVAARFPEEVAGLAEGALDVKIGGGESWLELYARVDEAFASLRARLEPGQRALVVTHGGVIHGLMSGLLGLRDTRPRPIGRISNTALTTVRVDPEGVTVVRYNDSGHLGPLGQWVSERVTAEDTVVTLVAHDEGAAPDVPGEERAGRARGHRPMMAVEQLAGWYPRLDMLHSVRDPRLRNAAAVVAERHGTEVSDHPFDLGDPPRALNLAGETGRRVGLVAPPAAVAAAAEKIVGGRARMAPPAHASIAHVVRTRKGYTLGDYNVGARKRR